MKEEYLSTLVFENYLVTELSYRQNRKFNFETDELDVNFDINAKVQLTNGVESAVTLKVSCGEEDNPNCPFLIEVEIIGIFKFDGIEEDLANMASKNAIAILFPYVRALVSDLSSRSNVYPQYKLPLMNVAEFIKDNKKIEIVTQ
ncbi:TPA: protein-export chaperone SecB [Streptococcus suis]|nr:protein-export chaperone SecB [Streptococcus suis]